MEKTILHIDMDAFYASVEQLDNPSFIGRPVIVGGLSNRSVVSAASYEARKYGVHSAMPIFLAKRKCPHGIFTPVRMDRYREISQRIMAVLDNFSPVTEQVSIDEAFVDITGTEKLLGPSENIGIKIKQEIKEKEKLTCSVGIAPNRFLAKVASDMEKPDGLTVINPDEAYDFIQHLYLEKVPGIGENTIGILHKMGAYKLGDIHRLIHHTGYKNLGKFGGRILELANGIDETPIVTRSKAKSISSENTLQEDTDDHAILIKHLLIQAEIVGARLREKDLKGSTITLKLKTSDFKQMTRSVTINKPSNSSQAIYKESLILLGGIDPSLKFRLIGVSVSNFTNSDSGSFTGQLDLFQKSVQEGNENHWEDAEEAIDAIRGKFGMDAITRGVLIANDPQTRKK